MGITDPTKGPQCSWPFVERRARNIFGDDSSGKDRFFITDGIINITFNLSDSIQLYEHDFLLNKLKEYNIKYDSDFAVQSLESGILLTKDDRVCLKLDKANIMPDALNECLLPLFAHTAMVNGKPQKFYHGNGDPLMEHLRRVTGRNWEGIIPSPYLPKVQVVSPIVPTPNLSKEQRREQQYWTMKAFLPRSRFSQADFDCWLDSQEKTEAKEGLPITTALPRDSFHMDRDSYQHLIDKEKDRTFINKVQRAFVSDKPKTSER